MTNQDYFETNCNWMVEIAASIRQKVLLKRLIGVVGLENRCMVKIEVLAMDYNELLAEFKAN